jgi:hypothetical protein
VLRAGDGLNADDVRALIGWSGVVPDEVEFPYDDDQSPGFVARPGNSAWTALWRYVRDYGAIARPGRLENVDTDWLSHPSVSVLEGLQDPYEGDPDVEYVEYGATMAGVAHPQGRYRRRVGDERTVFVALGLDDARTGEGWHVRMSDDSFGGVRRRPVVVVDRGKVESQLAEISDGERKRRIASDALVQLECPAHVGLELYDLVAFGGRNYRVVAIRETWKGGRLDQEVELG